MQSTPCEMSCWMKHNWYQLVRRNISNLRHADDSKIMAETEEELKSLLMKVKEESEKADIKIQHSETKIMAYGPITSLQIDGETRETVADFIFLGSKITADGDCNHESKRSLLLRRKDMTNLDSVLKKQKQTNKNQRYHFADKGLGSQSYGFLIAMHAYEIWILKKAEH